MIERIVRHPLGDKSPEARLLYGVEVLEGLKLLEPASVHCVVTSPPYWSLRDYGVEGQVGLEETPEAYVSRIVEVFRGLKRVLRPDGVAWLNLGDSFAGGGGTSGHTEETLNLGRKSSSYGAVATNGRVPIGLKAKDMVGIPWRCAFALQADGWYLRSACPWIKANVMPESCTDRPSSQVEFIFLLAHPDSGGKYYYDIHGARVPLAHGSYLRLNQPTFARQTGGEKDYGNEGGANANRSARRGAENLKAKLDAGEGSRQRRTSDWFTESIRGILNGEQGILTGAAGDVPLAVAANPVPYPGSHFAVFPQKLVEPLVRLGTSELGCCSVCGTPWEREVGEPTMVAGKGSGNVARKVATGGERGRLNTHVGSTVPWTPTSTPTIGWQPGCTCEGEVARCTVLDPFSGSATTGEVSMSLGKNYVGIDLNAEYLPLAEARLLGTAPPEVKNSGRAAEGSALDLFGDDS